MLVVGFLVCGLHSTASAELPAWCKGQDYRTSKYSVKFRGDTGDFRDRLRTTIRNIVEGSCTSDPSVNPLRAEMEKLRAEVSKELFMNDADWADAVAFLQNAWSGTVGDIEISANSIGSLTPMDQYVVMTRGFKAGRDSEGDWLYRADALDPVMTETGRLGILVGCVDFRPRAFGRDDGWIVNWAICREDVNSFNFQRMAGELRSDTAHPPEHKMLLRIRAAAVREKIKEIESLREDLFKRDEAYKKVFDVAAQGRDEWRKGVGTKKELLSLLGTVESAHWFRSRKQFEGCEEKTRKALVDAAANVPAKLLQNIFDERDNPFRGFAVKAAPVLAYQPEFNLAASAYALCQPETGIGAWLAYVASYAPGFRGPRTAAFTAIYRERFELDDTQLAEVPKPKMGSRPFRTQGLSSFGGVLQSFKPAGGEQKGLVTANLEKTYRMQEECVKERPTRRISQILSDGTIRYETICEQWKTVKRDYTWAPFTVTEETSKSVKKGNMFSAVTGTSSSKAADVIAVWPNKNAKQPSILLGAPIK